LETGTLIANHITGSQKQRNKACIIRERISIGIRKEKGNKAKKRMAEIKKTKKEIIFIFFKFPTRLNLR